MFLNPHHTKAKFNKLSSTIIPNRHFYICKFLNVTSLISLLRLPSKCFSWHWVSQCERMSFLLQLILTPQKADDSHCIIFLMHSFIKYVPFSLYLGCFGLTYLEPRTLELTFSWDLHSWQDSYVATLLSCLISIIAYSKHPHIRTHDFGGQADWVLIYRVLDDKSASKCS